MKMTDTQRLASIETTVNEIKERLFGGDIDEGEIGHLKARVAKLEKAIWVVLGGAAVVGFFSGGGGKALAALLGVR